MQNHKWELGPLETSDSVTNHTVLHAQKDRWYLGPIEICCSGPKGPVLQSKTTDEGWNPDRLVIMMLGTLFCMHKTTGYVWDP